MTRHGQYVSRQQLLSIHPCTIHSRAVAAGGIAYEPIAFFKGQAAMLRRYICKPEDHIAILATANQECLPQKRDRVTATDGDQLAIHRRGTRLRNV